MVTATASTTALGDRKNCGFPDLTDKSSKNTEQLKIELFSRTQLKPKLSMTENQSDFDLCYSVFHQLVPINGSHVRDLSIN